MLSWKKKTCIINLIPLQAFHLKKKKKNYPEIGRKTKEKDRGGELRTSAVVKILQTRKMHPSTSQQNTKI